MQKEKSVTDDQLIQRMQKLLETFGGVREDFDLNVIRNPYAKKEYTSCIAAIKEFLGIPFKLKIAYVNSGGEKNGNVWVGTPANLNYLAANCGINYCEITVYLRKLFLAMNPSIETFSYAIAHEMSHVILNTLDHPLRNSEVAVDLTTAIHGFSLIMHIGRQQQFYFFPGNKNVVCIRELGYLSDEQSFRTHLFVSRLQVEQDVHSCSDIELNKRL